MRIAKRAALVIAVLLVALQLVPYGRDHSDPAPTQPAKFDSARTEQLFAGACGDCHSDETDWPWYSNVAPVSFLVYNDVVEGRDHFNVSEWDGPQPVAGEVAESIQEGEMPPIQYKLIHGSARLSDAEKQALIDGLNATYAADPPATTR
jgi:mono/diheme cytochrome c family protein